MEWRYLYILSQTALLLLLSKVQPGSAEQCMCSDIQCISIAIETHNSSAAGGDPECCLWDFPPNRAVGVANELQVLGYAFGRTTPNAPRFCITYPVPNSSVDLNNYFLVKLDLQGPDVCISEPGRSENKSCSALLQNIPVKKADYCSGVPVTGAQFVNFSVDCLNCDEYIADFQFRVYSEAFNTTQEKWCDKVDKSVPSERYLDSIKPNDDQDKDKDKDPRTDEGSSHAESLTTDDGDSSGASRLAHTLSAFTLLTVATLILVA